MKLSASCIWMNNPFGYSADKSFYLKKRNFIIYLAEYHTILYHKNLKVLNI